MDTSRPLWSPSDRPGGPAGKRLRVILYARVSTDMQAEEGKSIAAQLAEMREYAAQRNWTIVAEFVDPGYTGTDMNRPGLQALLAAVEQKQSDVVLVHELSRLSRRLFDTFQLFETFGHYAVGFASVKDNDFDFSSPTGRLFLTILAALNQYYVDLLKMHTAKSKRERAREGLHNASIPPLGYRLSQDPDQPPLVVPEEAALVRQLFERYATGQYSYQELAEWLSRDAGLKTRAGHNFSKDTLADMLRNPFYKGVILYRQGLHGQAGGEFFPGKHEPIVTPDLWERCRQVREQRHAAPRTYQPKYRVYLLNGLVTCDCCGRKLRAQGAATGDYYREVSAERGFTDCPVAGRGTPIVPLDEQVGAIFRALRLPPDWQRELQALLADDSQQETLANRRARLVAERQRLKQMKVQGEFDEDPQLYEQELARIQRQLGELPPEDDFSTLTYAAELLEHLATVWDAAELSDRRDLLRLALKEVRVDVTQHRVATLEPHPIFIPLFRQIPFLRELEFGIFAPVWPLELAATLTSLTVLPALTQVPAAPPPVAGPLVVALPPALLGDRITPQLSAWLKARRKANLDYSQVVELVTPTAPPLRTDARKWPAVEHRRVTALDALPDASVQFLWSPLAIQAAPDLAALLATARRVLAPGGVWVSLDLVPDAMPGHWLFRYFPETWPNETQRALAVPRLFTLFSQAGFQVTLERRTYYQPVSLGAAWTLAQQRAASPALQRLPDEVYTARLAALQAELQRAGPHTLLSSEFCLVVSTAQRPGPPTGSAGPSGAEAG